MHLVVVGGSDAGISAALRARELDDRVEITVMVADDYPNFSICGIPYYVAGEVADWRDLAHRTRSDIEGLGIGIRTGTSAEEIDVAGHRVTGVDRDGGTVELGYDRLVIATGACPVRPGIDGLAHLGPAEGVHLLHTMTDAHRVMDAVTGRDPGSAVIVGAGYIGLEMAEALTARGIAVTQMEALPQVLPTLDPELAGRVAEKLEERGVKVRTSTVVTGIRSSGGRLTVEAAGAENGAGHQGASEESADLVLVVTGVRPESGVAGRAGIGVTRNGAIRVDRRMGTGAPDVFAAGDCAVTHHVLVGETYLPLGTTAHKQGRIAGENAVGGDRRFAGSLGTQVVKVFDLVAGRTGLRDQESVAAGFHPRTVGSAGDDHKAYYPGAERVEVRMTGEVTSGRLLGTQMVGRISTGVHKRIDTAAAAIFAGLTVDQVSDLDLSYTPPLGSPWDVLQTAAQGWTSAVAGVGGAGGTR